MWNIGVHLAIQALSLLDHVYRLWLHFDIDVFDPALMPVCFPEPDGLSIEETLGFLSASMHSKRVLGISFLLSSQP
jgi:arginase family enzyme